MPRGISQKQGITNARGNRCVVKIVVAARDDKKGAKRRLRLSGPLGDSPLLLLLGLARLLGGIGSPLGVGGEVHGRRRVGSSDGRTPRGARGRARVLLAERRLSVLLSQVTAAPDAGADPDAGNANNKNDEHDNPLPVVGEPARHVSNSSHRVVSRTYQSPPPPPPLFLEELPVLADWPEVVVVAPVVVLAPLPPAFFTLQMPWNQPAIDCRPPLTPSQALSQTPEVPLEKGATLGWAQKQDV